jgi:tRNA nucleotidyltransferase (CCA-adding enzyme)
MIQLTEQERKIFELLLAAAPPGTELRAAGGWVRDKCLGRQSHDIDIAVNNMSGAKFARLVADHMKNSGLKAGRVTVIDARPDQSKHLETAQLSILGQMIDFANLRKETYAESRIPVIEPGTPEEDARRRDLTINALFYNLGTGEIEDYVGGLNDLSLCAGPGRLFGLARTPIDPLQTFLDDPLRVLRTIRFCTKYNLWPDPELTFAACDSRVHEALLKKVSKERVWAEMVGQAEPDGGWKNGFMIEWPCRALRLVEQFGLRDLLFKPKGSELLPWDLDQQSSHHDLNVWQHTHKAVEFLSQKLGEHSPADAAVRHLAMLFHDLGKLDPEKRTLHEDGEHYQYLKHELASADLAEAVLKQWCAPNEIRERVVRLVKEHMRIPVMTRPNDPNAASNRALRRVLRDVGEDWEHLVDVATGDANGKGQPVGKVYEDLRERMRELVKEMAGLTKPKRPINGNDLKDVGVEPGPEMGRIFRALDEALLDNPGMTREESISYVQELLINQVYPDARR